MCRILGDYPEYGIAAKLADDLYCGADSPHQLEEDPRCPPKVQYQTFSIQNHYFPTLITTILGWTWTEGCLSASTHRIATMSSCPPSDTVRGLRSFIGAYKILRRVLPQAHISSHHYKVPSQDNNYVTRSSGQILCTNISSLLNPSWRITNLLPFPNYPTNYG
jgi:hypothetical protein